MHTLIWLLDSSNTYPNHCIGDLQQMHANNCNWVQQWRHNSFESELLFWFSPIWIYIIQRVDATVILFFVFYLEYFVTTEL